ncbi:DUF7467 domain-containing protein [Streptomyces sp. NRRL F-5123]|uniref:DUF7467 domain-containing protein n=1 Tax=Streptomyces sp. NRRL F-5123 TaxID=1463856 RepID=UPI00131E4C57|nr:hypothetical protein [Streptomyces sp. NRRL F-5123]
MLRLKRAAVLVAAMATAALVLLGAAGPASAAGSSAAARNVSQSTATHQSAKPPAGNQIVVVNSFEAWATQKASVAVTTSQSVTGSGFYVRIYDYTIGAYIGTCNTGTICTAYETSPVAAGHGVDAFIADNSASFPPGHIQSEWDNSALVWKSTYLDLEASATTAAPGATVTLTSTAGTDISSSPFSNEIFDTTTGALLASCKTGTTCSATVTEAQATTHAFTAYFGDNGTTAPPAALQATSQTTYVTWTNSGWTVSLSAAGGVWVGSTFTATATASADVGTAHYYIEIFNENGTLLASCASGTTCSASVANAGYFTDLVAFVTPNSTTLPPSGLVAASNATETLGYVPFAI